VAAGAIVVALMFGLRLAIGIQALPDVAADAMTLILPGSVFGFLIDRLQEYGRPSLLVGVAVGLVALCGLLGAIAATRLARLGHVPRGAVTAGALAVLTLPVVLLGAGEDAAGPAIATAGYWALFAVLLELGLSPAAARPLVAAHSPERRALLLGAGALAGLWLATYLGGRLGRAASLGGTRPTVAATLPPAPATTPVPGATDLPPADAFPGMTGITTTRDFYVITKNGLDDPTIDAGRWRLQVAGQRPYAIGYDELRGLPVYEAPRTLECISNIVGGSLISAALFAGPPLRDLLERAGIPTGTKEIRFNCADGYTESLLLDAALDPTTIVAHTMNGEALSKDHGFPARLLLSGRYGVKNPKWLTALVPLAQPYNGYWEQRGWNKDAFVRTFSRLDLPQDGAVVPAGRPYPFIRGVGYAGSRGISKVEISFDSGKTWDTTQLRRVLPTDNWTPFTYIWTPPGPGAYEVVVRAYDGAGSVQDATERDSFPDGATGLHRTSINVT
jgi:DMSO/TMAO reductase YedYZ molybdopterin-dependent catalytic subunit